MNAAPTRASPVNGCAPSSVARSHRPASATSRASTGGTTSRTPASATSTDTDGTRTGETPGLRDAAHHAARSTAPRSIPVRTCFQRMEPQSVSLLEYRDTHTGAWSDSRVT
ncbi:hypothetical protein COSO111634_31935 [Corallococcus soli]